MKRVFKITNGIVGTMLLVITSVYSQNPIVPNVGLNDPHIHIFNDTAYVYASHDKSIKNDKFIMEDWWVWSSTDLVNWTKRSVLSPKDTYIGKEFSRCWATDAAYRNGNYYFYFSEGNEQTGVVVGETPVGPWKDVLGKPLLSSDLTPTHEYDMAIFEDNGEHYIIFGVWDYYIAKLNEDMISLAESPKKIIINNPRGPYNPDGSNTKMPTDDKPFVHKYNGKYYLSWGCFYAMADNVYGPYDYKDTVIKEESFAEGFDAPTWPNGFLQGRHGSFFEWHNQWYYIYCDISQTGNRYFRDSFISYLHYKDNGEMATIRVDGIGVGNYNANNSIEAEDYFKSEGIIKIENTIGGFSIQPQYDNSYTIYSNVKGLNDKNSLELQVIAREAAQVDVRADSTNGKLLFTCNVPKNDMYTLQNRRFDIENIENTQSICFVYKGIKDKSFILNRFQFKN
ncbi:Carbohydrate binding module (family 6) [Hyunsoonleella jejuensis]|uniref:Carbohydrate binding module (Family 6) n=1 Tax=Hyunsoonleella jejuensis TaxID=419940 RepID=A0A1H9IQ11_9FLAO|nr:family 43 glycosylhydrolase [Hyunsoonleella jejuensis]SEQ76485.1 Carbohydrate binding module (family 6) [Hyunsoonleella jejuensis]